MTSGLSLISWIMRDAFMSGRHSPTPSTTEKGQLPAFQPRHIAPSLHRFHFILVVLVWRECTIWIFRFSTATDEHCYLVVTVLISVIVLQPGLVPAIYGYFTREFFLSQNASRSQGTNFTCSSLLRSRNLCCSMEIQTGHLLLYHSSRSSSS